MIQWPKQRAWGWYATLIRTPWLCVKVLKFQPWKSLSLQKHAHRTEVWFFIKGYGIGNLYDPVSCNIHHTRIYDSFCLTPKKSVWFIPSGYWHQFGARRLPVYAIELQYGRKVTELDIERK